MLSDTIPHRIQGVKDSRFFALQRTGKAVKSMKDKIPHSWSKANMRLCKKKIIFKHLLGIIYDILFFLFNN